MKEKTTLEILKQNIINYLREKECINELLDNLVCYSLYYNYQDKSNKIDLIKHNMYYYKGVLILEDNEIMLKQTDRSKTITTYTDTKESMKQVLRILKKSDLLVYLLIDNCNVDINELLKTYIQLQFKYSIKSITKEKVLVK